MESLPKILDARIKPALWIGLLCGVLIATGCGRPSAASPAEKTVESTPNLAANADSEEMSPPPVEKSAAIRGDAVPQSPPESAATTPAAAKPTSQRPKADRTSARPGEAEKITFEDLFLNMQADVVFRDFMLTDRVKELDGKRVSLAGYMYGGVASTRGIKEFILLRNKECKFGPGGQADHLAQVIMRKGASTDFTPASVNVEGKLKVEDFKGPDGNTWSIYRLEDAQVR